MLAVMLAVMDMMAVPVMAAMMTRASGMTTPVMDGRPMAMGALGDVRRARPDSGRRRQNARNDDTYKNHEASHEMDPSLRPRGSRSPSLSLDLLPAGLGCRGRAGTETRPSATRRERINFLLESAQRWPFVAGAGTIAPVAVDA